MADEQCSACAGTGRVLDGEICRFCEGDLVARLRSVGGYFDDAALEHVSLAECADEIERLRNKINSAPVAIMDTRDVLGICAPDEEAFPALYALQGKRVRLVLDDEVPNAELWGAPPTGGASHTNAVLGAAVPPAPTFDQGENDERD